MSSLKGYGGISAAMALALAASVATPSTALPTSQKPSRQRQGTNAGPTITVSGCIQRESDVNSAMGSVDPDDHELALTQTSMGANASASASGSKETSTDLKGAIYQLTGAMEDALKKYIGQRVEITGTVVGPAGEVGSPKSGQSATTAEVGRSSATNKSATRLTRLRITSVRELGGSCASTP